MKKYIFQEGNNILSKMISKFGHEIRQPSNFKASISRDMILGKYNHWNLTKNWGVCVL
jgi:hypothetical protein